MPQGRARSGLLLDDHGNPLARGRRREELGGSLPLHEDGNLEPPSRGRDGPADHNRPHDPGGADVPLEIEVRIALPETTDPKVASVQDIWVGADWNEKETWDLVGIDFEGHVGMRRVLQPHETPVGFHPLQKQHKLRYHDFEEMYDDAQGFLRKPSDAGKIK